VYIALAFICLGNEKIGYVAANMVFIAGGIAAEYFLQTETKVSLNATK
jgi:hypothetical protein